MVTFKGTPNMLVVLKPPIGTTKHVRFDGNGNFTTENERMIQRFHHKFDSVPTPGAVPTEELDDDVELQDHGQPVTKQYNCNQCDFTSENKGVLLAHKKTEHPKEEKDE
jgi:hypothetical protein